MSFNLLRRGEPQRVQTGVVSANYFDALGVKPLFGRTLRIGDDQSGANPVIVLSYRFWRERMGGDPAIIGKTVEMTDRLTRSSASCRRSPTSLTRTTCSCRSRRVRSGRPTHG